MDPVILKLRILVRAEMALIRIHARRAEAQASLFTVALIFALLSLAALNFAGFYALAPHLGNAGSALLVALANGVLAGMLIMASRRAGPSEGEEKMAQDVRDMAYAELSTDFEAVKAELARISEDIDRIRAGFASLTSGLSSGLVSALGLITKALK